MRILIWSFVPPSPDSAYWFMMQTGMAAVGHQVIVVDAFALTALYGIKGMQQILLHTADSYRVNAALVLAQNFVEPHTLQALRDRGIAVIAYRYDDCLLASPGSYAATRTELAAATMFDSHCDIAVTFSRHVGPQLAAHGLPVPHYLPHPYGWQAVPIVDLPMRPVIAYAGSPKHRADGPTSWRVQVARAIADAGLPMELHHDGWASIPGLEAYARPVPDLAGFFDLFRTATVNLCLLSDWLDRPYYGLKTLTLEIASAGGMQITQPSDELNDLFEVGTDLITASTPEAIVDRARYYLAHPEEARQLGRNSRRAMEAKAGWDLWWQSVADLLAARGIDLPLDAPPVTPDKDDCLWLATTRTALAHAYEANGETTLARVYFQQVLDWIPDDYAAHAGLARLAEEPADARQHWRQAAESVALTQAVKLPGLFGMHGIGELNTCFRGEAAIKWLRGSLAADQPDEVTAALDLACPYDPHLALTVADRLYRSGHVASARQALEIGLRHWPEATAVADALSALRRQSGTGP